MDGTQCEVCDCTFDKLLNRRHHCRACGDLVCSDCSKNKILVDGYDTPQRACDNCYFSANQSRAGKEVSSSTKGSKDATNGGGPPAKRKECQSCGSVFDIFNRRHHCRVCDRTLCQKCSKYKLPEYGRACRPCFDRHNGPAPCSDKHNEPAIDGTEGFPPMCTREGEGGAYV